MTKERPDPLRAGPQLYRWRTGNWLTKDDITTPLVVFIHGFAASGAAFATLAGHVDQIFTVAVFDYLSHEGIDRGSLDLSRRLIRFVAPLNKARFALIGHSMGGLVAKQFARHTNAELRQALAGIATLCSPHGAAMPERPSHIRRRLLAMMLDFVERNEPPNPFTRSLFCPAARQLLGEDASELIANLLEADNIDPLNIPMLTLSAGRNYIELFEPGSRLNRAANNLIQSNLTLPNDGLVEESSADLTKCLNSHPTFVRHCNDYGAWSDTNHTHVVLNQDVGDLLVEWLQNEVF